MFVVSAWDGVVLTIWCTTVVAVRVTSVGSTVSDSVVAWFNFHDVLVSSVSGLGVVFAGGPRGVLVSALGLRGAGFVRLCRFWYIAGWTGVFSRCVLRLDVCLVRCCK